MTAEMQFLPDLLQSGERLTHVLDLDNDWQSKVAMLSTSKSLLNEIVNIIFQGGEQSLPEGRPVSPLASG